MQMQRCIRHDNMITIIMTKYYISILAYKYILFLTEKPIIFSEYAYYTNKD